MGQKRIIIGISGASGTIYGVRLLERLRSLEVETHLVVSPSGLLTARLEMGLERKDFAALCDHIYAPGNIAASISSGSFQTMGMIVAPCSVKSLAEIATGVTAELLPRAADVVLKERRRLVLMVRETPLHAGHLRNMLAATEMGAVIMPPVPAFYDMPADLEDMVSHSVIRVLDLFGLDSPDAKRWSGLPPAR